MHIEVMLLWRIECYQTVYFGEKNKNNFQLSPTCLSLLHFVIVTARVHIKKILQNLLNKTSIGSPTTTDPGTP